MMGDVGSIAPYPALKSLPVFSSLRVPSRYTLITVLALGMAGTSVLAQWLNRWNRSVLLKRWVVFGLSIALMGPLLWHTNNTAGQTVCRTSPGDSVATRGDFHLVNGDRWRMWRTLRRGLGTLPCNEAAHVPRSVDSWIGPRQQVEVVPRDAGVATLDSFTTQTWSLNTSLERPAVIRLNQNFRAGFWVSEGRLVNLNGLVGVELEPGDWSVDVRFAPWELILGLLISLFSWIYVARLGLHSLKRQIRLPEEPTTPFGKSPRV